jgi:hypothetical protein
VAFKSTTLQYVKAGKGLNCYETACKLKLMDKKKEKARVVES